MYLTPTSLHWACDIEADDLLENVTKIHCVCVINLVTKEERSFTDGEEFRAWLERDYILVGHNFLAYDLVVLNRLWGARIPSSRVVDTFVLSQLYNPNYSGGHSLEAWGLRLKYPKGAHEDFSKFTPQMLAYCKRDTRLAALLFIKLSERMRQVGFSEKGIELEHQAWNIIQNKQKRNGFPFDYKRAQELYLILRTREEELKNEIYKLWPPKLQCVGEYRKAYKKDGSHSADYKRHIQQYPKSEINDDGSYRVFDYVSFNLGSPPQRVAKLLELGWEPTERTKAGNPKVDEDSLLAFAELSNTPEIKALAKWVVINSRANMLYNVKKNGEEGGWLVAYNEKTGAIHGNLFIAATLRYRHNNPNSANIPAVRLKKDENGNEQIQYGEEGLWTYECRDLWTCGNPEEWSLVGLDGTGIQNRCLVHGLIATVGAEIVEPFKNLSLSGDIHKRNIEVLGLANKAAAKKFYYTLMMGGGGARLAADQAQFGTKLSAREGDKLKKKMIETIPGFYEFIEALKKELRETGRIKLCDETPILVSSEHMVIPYKLQGDESRLMKQAMVYVDQEVRRHGLAEHVLKVADIHDEWQYRVRNPYVDQFIGMALPCFPRAGESFNYNIIIEGDAKVGKTWAQTH